MAESQQAHREAQEAAVNAANIQAQLLTSRRLDRGQWMAFVLAIAGMASSAVFVWAGHPIVGSVFGGVTLLGLVGAFLVDRSKTK